MDKRLEKRHKRKVERAREHKKVSEPDVRTPEQIKAARELSRPTIDNSAPFARNRPAAVPDSAAKTDEKDGE
jgi:hypothetical protein